MQFLVLIGLEDNGGSVDGQHTMAMITRFVMPSLEALVKLEGEGRLAGGPVAGSARFVFIAQAESVSELETLLTSLPFWSVMRVEITPLVAFGHRLDYVQQRLAQVQASGATVAQAAR